MRWSIAVCVLIAFSVARASNDYLLPGDVVPTHYDVRLLFDMDPNTNFSYYGVADIYVTTKKPTTKIILHAQDFSFENDAIKFRDDSREFRPKTVSLNDTYNLLTIQFQETLKMGQNYTLTIPFYGNLKMGLDGAYISNYVNKKTQEKEYLITTQFESISARKGFPCFDEPLYKATFSLSIGHNKDYTAVSNMPLQESSDDNLIQEHWPWQVIKMTFQKDKSEFVWDQFVKSVPMSTYLVAYVVSRFSYVESPSELSEGTTFRIWARKDAIDQTAYAATTGPKVLTHFERFFNVSFPLPKQDMIAIPDFSAGAMENWGLITYRETALLYDKEQSSLSNKERVAEVIAHELAHQWFGNLVTMKWWSDLWLNEGFATYVASIGVHAVEPSWGADLNLAVDSMMAVMNLDSLESSHPVSAPIDDPKRISEIFDEISYRKGSALIRMMTMFLGNDVFRKAIHQYLVKHSYSNAEQDDLWHELTEVSKQYNVLTRNVTVKQVMDTWTTQTGYPLLTVIRDYSDNTVTVTQKRYLNLGAKASTAVSWWVPLSVMCQSEVGQSPDPVQWLANNEGVTNKHRYEHSAGSKEWVLFNYDMIAPYRVNYDARNWQLLIKALSSRDNSIPITGRVQLLSDAFALAWTNQLNYSTALQLSNYLQHETEYLPLSVGLRQLAKIENVLKRTADYGAYQKYVRKLITEQYMQSGGLATKKIVNADDLKSVRMQTMLSSWACRMKVPGCEENALELFEAWMNTEDPDKNNPIPLDLRHTVYCTSMSRGSVRHWRFLLARKQKANVAAAQDALQHALACTREVWILKQFLEMAITDGSDIRRQDAGKVIASITSSTVGYYVAKEFIYTRIDDIFVAFKRQSRHMKMVIKSLLAQFTTQREIDEFLTWRESNGKYLEEIQLAVSQGIEAANVNINWLTRNRKTVVDQLRELSA